MRVRSTNASLRAPVLYSYDTPVAVRVNGEWLTTEKRFSASTSRHVREHAPGARVLSHEEFLEQLPDADREYGARRGRL